RARRTRPTAKQESVSRRGLKEEGKGEGLFNRSPLPFPPLPSSVLWVDEAAAARCMVELVFVCVAGQLDWARPLDARSDVALLLLHADRRVGRQAVVPRGGAQLLRDPLVGLPWRVCSLVDRLLHEVFEKVCVVCDGRVVVCGVAGEPDDDGDENEVEARAAPLAGP